MVGLGILSTPRYHSRVRSCRGKEGAGQPTFYWRGGGGGRGEGGAAANSEQSKDALRQLMAEARGLVEKWPRWLLCWLA